MVAPSENASTRFTTPADIPFTEAIQVASGSDTLRVRLLSIPQARQAPSTATAGHSQPPSLAGC